MNNINKQPKTSYKKAMQKKQIKKEAKQQKLKARFKHYGY